LFWKKKLPVKNGCQNPEVAEKAATAIFVDSKQRRGETQMAARHKDGDDDDACAFTAEEDAAIERALGPAKRVKTEGGKARTLTLADTSHARERARPRRRRVPDDVRDGYERVLFEVIDDNKDIAHWLTYSNDYGGASKEHLRAFHGDNSGRIVFLPPFDPEGRYKTREDYLHMPDAEIGRIPQDHPGWMHIRGKLRTVSLSALGKMMGFFSMLYADTLGITEYMALPAGTVIAEWEVFIMRNKHGLGVIPSIQCDAIMARNVTYGKKHEDNSTHCFLRAFPRKTVFECGTECIDESDLRYLDLTNRLTGEKITKLNFRLPLSLDLFVTWRSKHGATKTAVAEIKTPVCFVTKTPDDPRAPHRYPGLQWLELDKRNPYPMFKAYYALQVLGQMMKRRTTRAYALSWSLTTRISIWKMHYKKEMAELMLTLLIYIVDDADKNGLAAAAIRTGHFDPRFILPGRDGGAMQGAPMRVIQMHQRLVALCAEMVTVYPGEHAKGRNRRGAKLCRIDPPLDTRALTAELFPGGVIPSVTYRRFPRKPEEAEVFSMLHPIASLLPSNVIITQDCGTSTRATTRPITLSAQLDDRRANIDAWLANPHLWFLRPLCQIVLDRRRSRIAEVQAFSTVRMRRLSEVENYVYAAAGLLYMLEHDTAPGSPLAGTVECVAYSIIARIGKSPRVVQQKLRELQRLPDGHKWFSFDSEIVKKTDHLRIFRRALSDFAETQSVYNAFAIYYYLFPETVTG
jgi:hypothetical protein